MHFFDIHYLEEKAVSKFPRQIFKEASFATRFSLLSSDTTIIPAAVYVESTICHEILNKFIELVPFGVIELIGNARSFTEFCGKKIIQYANRPGHQKLYADALEKGVQFPFRRRERSATQDISNSWVKLLHEKDVGSSFSKYAGIEIDSKFEDRWGDIPSSLGDRAFIVPNVSSLLFLGNIENISVENELYSIINPSYFKSYVDELGASIVTNLNFLESNYNISNNEINIPYKYILQELKKRSLLEYIENQNPCELMIWRENGKWDDIFCSACERTSRNISELGLFYNRFSANARNTTINAGKIYYFNGGINMGDQYNAKQVGAQGPNAHAHDMTFNQLWQNNDRIDLTLLSGQLMQLRLHMARLAETPEQHMELGILAGAEIEAKNGNGAKVLELLSKTGEWTVSVAEKIGVSLVASTLSKILA